MDENMTPNQQDQNKNQDESIQKQPVDNTSADSNAAPKAAAFDDYVPNQTENSGSKGFAIASLVLGIVAVAFFCLWYISLPCGVVGLILGILSLQRKQAGHGMALAGVILGIIAVVLSVIFLILAAIGIASLANMGALS